MSRPPASLQPHIDSTMMTCFRSCPQKFYNEFILGLRPKAVSIDLHAGAAFAHTREVFARAIHEERLPTPAATSQAFKAFSEIWGDFPVPEKSAKTFDRMWEAFLSYIETYPPHTDHIQPYHGADGKATFEFSFTIPLETEWGFPHHPETGESFLYVGRFDLLGLCAGRPVVLDDKTTKSAGDGWAEQWDLRNQFLGYVWACQTLGIHLDMVVVRGIVIQKTSIRHLEAIKIYPDYMIERWFQQLRQDMWRLVSAWEQQYFSYNFGDTCTSYGRCPFTSLCSAKDPEPWMAEYTVRRWNPIKLNPLEEIPT